MLEDKREELLELILSIGFVFIRDVLSFNFKEYKFGGVYINIRNDISMVYIHIIGHGDFVHTFEETIELIKKRYIKELRLLKLKKIMR